MRKKQLLVLLLCLIGLILSGCWSHHKKDGPPPYPVDVSKIPDATPKAEPLSKLGNRPSYTVFGKTYHVLSSRKNYRAIGVASWYGTRFHTHRTSNGERYNMLAMTAAHRTLPLPTYLQVTNLENGKRVIVKVNDRGPFQGNRILDLSYAAAKKIGMSQKGTALVEIKALTPELHPRPLLIAHKKRPLFSGPHSRVYLDVAQYPVKLTATRLQHRLATLVNGRIHVRSISQGSRRIYQVTIGPLKDQRAAEKIQAHLKSLGLAQTQVAYDF